MTVSYPFDASRSGAGLRHPQQPGSAASSRLQRGRAPPHGTGNPFQQRRSNVRGWGGSGSSTSLVHDGGQAQLSLERQKEVQVETVQSQTGGITMEEVMKDLRILEEQQQESEMRLRQACRAKQQNQAALAALEESLQKSKYSNGRERAFLIRKQEVLARGQRMSHECEAGGETARTGLQALGGELNATTQLESNSRAAKRHLDWAWKKSSRLKELVESALKDAQGRLAAAKERHEEHSRQVSERQDLIQLMSTKHQATLLETAQMQTKCNKQESQVALLQADAAVLQEEATDLHRMMLDEAQHVNQFVCSSESSLDSLGAVEKDLLSRIQDEIAAKDAKMKIVFEHWQKIRETRLTERQDTIASNALDQEPPPVDLALIQQKVSIEVEALRDQCVSLDALRREVAALQDEHDKVNGQLQAVIVQASTLAKSNKAAQDLDAQRNREISDFIAEFESAKTASDRCDGLVPAIVARRSAIEAQLHESQEDLRLRQSDLSRVTAELSRLEKEEGSIAQELSRVLEQFNGCPNELNESLQREQESVIFLTSAKMDLAEHGKSTESLDGFDAFEVDADIQQMLQEFPRLDMIPIDRDAQLDEDEQVAYSLKALREACENTVSSALKMGLALREAKEREEEERILVQQAVAEEEKRKEEARVLHRKRRQDAETEEERLHREKRQRRKEQKREARLRASNPAINPVKADEACSAAKPRDLLERFSQASDCSSISTDYAPSSQVKKVHWGDGPTTQGQECRNPESLFDREESQSQGQHSFARQPAKRPSLLHSTVTVEAAPLKTTDDGKQVDAVVSTSVSRDGLVENLQSVRENRVKAMEPETKHERRSTATTLELPKSSDKSTIGSHRRPVPLKSSMKNASWKPHAVESSRHVDTSSRHKHDQADAEPRRSSKTSHSRPSSSTQLASRISLSSSRADGVFARNSDEPEGMKCKAAKPGPDGASNEVADNVQGKSQRSKANHGRASGRSKEEHSTHPKSQQSRHEENSSAKRDSRHATTTTGHPDQSRRSSSQRHSAGESKSSRSRKTNNDAKSSFEEPKRRKISSGDEMALSRGRLTDDPARGTLDRRQASKEKLGGVNSGAGESGLLESAHHRSTASNQHSGHEGSSKQRPRASHKGSREADHKSRETIRKQGGGTSQSVHRDSNKLTVGSLELSEGRRNAEGGTAIPKRSGGTASKVVGSKTTTSSASRAADASNGKVAQRELSTAAKHRRKPSSHGGKKHVNWHIDDSRSSFL